MKFPAFGMDTGFYSPLGSYSLDARCEMLAELGYDATYLTLWSDTAWADLPELGKTAARHGLGVAAVNVTVDASAPLDEGENARILTMIDTLSCGQTVEIAIRHGGDVRPFLERALDAAEANEVRLLLYPHTFFWMERAEDAIRLCEEFGSPRLGLVFSAFHWYAVEGTDLRKTLQAASPYLGLVNLCGSRRLAGQYFPTTIEPLDSGDLDNFALLGALRALSYTGMVGVQGYGVGGDAYDRYRRSITTLRELEDRLDAHPEWAELRPDHI